MRNSIVPTKLRFKLQTLTFTEGTLQTFNSSQLTLTQNLAKGKSELESL